MVVEDTGELNVYDTYVRGGFVRRALSRAGLAYEVVSDKQLAGGRTVDARVIVLPSNPSLPPAAAEVIYRFCNRGGKLLCFPPLPAGLEPLVGVERVERFTYAAAGAVEHVDLDQVLMPSLPATWRQREWAWQPFEPMPAAQVLATWHAARPAGAPRPAGAMVGSGAFCGATLNGDDRSAEAQLLLALVTHYAPELWHMAAPRILQAVGRVGDCASLSDVKRRVQAAPLSPDRRALAQSALTRATERRDRAEQLYEAGRRVGTTVAKPGQPAPPPTSPISRYLPSALLGWEAQQAAEQAYYLAQIPREREFRGVWLQNAGGLRDSDWEQTILALRENNISALFINVLNPGYANYPSAVLPHVTAEGADPLAEAVRWCRELGVECHVWMMVNYLRPLAPPEWFARLEREGRLQHDLSGQTLRWLRPGDARNRELTVRMAAEVARRYDIDGLHLDYIRYSGAETDYSPPEREAFEEFVHDHLVIWPSDTLLGGRWRGEWARWRQNHVSRQVQEIAAAARAARPGIRISAAVYPIFVDASFAVGQDPVTWAHQGWVDFLCPMNYHTNDTTFYRYLTAQQRDVGDRVPLYPGVAAWRHETPADTIAQVSSLRSMNMPGFVLFHLDRRLLGEWLPAMRLGATASPPLLAFTPPADAVAAAGGP